FWRCRMTAALLVSELPTAESPAISKGFADAFHLDPFPLLCAALCVRDGRLKTIVHHDSLSVVLVETDHLRCVNTVDGIEEGRVPFWIPRHPSVRKRLGVERRNRSRSHRTLPPPVWHGEPRPSGFRTVRLRTEFPSLDYLIRVCRDSGYPWSAAGAALPRAHAPWVHPWSDRRRSGCTNLGEIEREGNADSGAQRGYASQYDSQQYIDPYHPYVPASPARRTKVGGGFTRLQVVEAIANHGWDDETSYAL